MVKAKVWALVGSESLLGREIRDLVSSREVPVELKLIAADLEDPGKLTEQAGEASVLWGLDAQHVCGAHAVFLAGSAESTRKTLDVARRSTAVGPVLIDLTHAAEDLPQAQLRAPAVEAEGIQMPGDAVQVVAHPAAIAIALFLRQLHAQHPVRRSLVHVFEPASERGVGGLEELQQQTVNLLSFKGLPKKVFDAQLSFNMLARYGEDAPFALEEAEARIERHLATLLSLPGGESSIPPMPSLRLIQAPVFHGYSFSLWVEFAANPGVEALEQALAVENVDVRGKDLEAPTAVGMAGQSGIAVGAVRVDPNVPQACWFWMAADNLRLAAENALAVARQRL